MVEIRCAFISSYMGPYPGNYIASVVACEKAMQKKGYYSIYVFPKNVEHFDWVNMLREITSHIYFLDYAPYSLHNVRMLKEIFTKERINLIYSRMCGWDFTAHFAAPKLPIIWHMEMRVVVTEVVRRIKNWLKFNILAFGKTYHIAVSKPVTDAINSLHPKHRCTTIYNALDFTRLAPKRRAFPSNGPCNLLIFGWLPEVKGLDLALDACEILNRNGKQVHLLVSAQKATLDYVAERYHIQPAWLELIPPTDNISELYEKADVMLSASRSEGFSYALAEALYSGLPAIYSDIPGTSWADDFSSVYRFRSGDVNDLVRAISTCCEKPISEQQRNLNREKMMVSYSINTWTDKVITYMEEIMN